MAAKIRIYFEGDAKLKRGFAAFLASLREKAASARIGWELVAGGNRHDAFEDFELALRNHPDDIIALLVDAEGQVTTDGPWEHLASLQDAALHKPQGAKGEQAHLMVQVMESWFLTDRQVLAQYYGQGFAAGRLPGSSDVESVPKERVIRSLVEATEQTKKGRYHETRHAPDLLASIDPAKVRAASPWCNRLFETIETIIESP